MCVFLCLWFVSQNDDLQLAASVHRVLTVISILAFSSGRSLLRHTQPSCHDDGSVTLQPKMGSKLVIEWHYENENLEISIKRKARKGENEKTFSAESSLSIFEWPNESLGKKKRKMNETLFRLQAFFRDYSAWLIHCFEIQYSLSDQSFRRIIRKQCWPLTRGMRRPDYLTLGRPKCCRSSISVLKKMLSQRTACW